MTKRSTNVSLHDLFMDLQKEMTTVLSTGRNAISHPTSKGDDSENNWQEWFKKYLPERYKVGKAFVVDSKGMISEQIDLVIYDRQYSPFLFKHAGATYIPAESVYAVFEVKQILDKNTILYAGKKAASVRKLYRTSAKIQHAGGTYPPRPPIPILTGILTLDSKWKKIFSKPFENALNTLTKIERLDLVCSLEKGAAAEIKYNSHEVEISKSEKDNALIFLFLKLLARLQDVGTCSAIEFPEYIKSMGQ